MTAGVMAISLTPIGEAKPRAPSPARRRGRASYLKGNWIIAQRMYRHGQEVILRMAIYADNADRARAARLRSQAAPARAWPAA